MSKYFVFTSKSSNLAKPKKTEALSDIITQTDRDGKPKARASPVEIISVIIDIFQSRDTTDSSVDRESSFFSYICCCFYPEGRKSERSTELTRPSSSRNPITQYTPFFVEVQRSRSPSKRLSISGQSKLLPPRNPASTKKCLALDLDETLVHSSFQVDINHFVSHLTSTV